MSLTQTVIGGAVFAFGLNAALSLVLPDITGIHINQLTYADGAVTQDRTVVGDSEYFYAQWAAMVVDAETGHAVPGCAGDGAAPYAAGRRVVKLQIAEWVGNENCTIERFIPGKAYELRAVWSWGEDSVSAKAEFVK